SPPSTAKGWTTLRCPSVVPLRITACASTRLPAPMITPSSITAKAPTSTPSPSVAPGATTASGCMSGLAIHDRREELPLGAERAVDAGLAAELPDVGAVVEHLDVEVEAVPGRHRVPELRLVDAEEEHQVVGRVERLRRVGED